MEEMMVMVSYQCWPLPGSAQHGNCKGVLWGGVKMKKFNGNTLEETSLGRKQSLKQENLYLLTYKQMPIFWTDVGVRTSGVNGAIHLQEGRIMCHVQGTHDIMAADRISSYPSIMWYWCPCGLERVAFYSYQFLHSFWMILNYSCLHVHL